MAKSTQDVNPNEKQLHKAAKKIAKGKRPFTKALEVSRGFRLDAVDPRSTPAFTGNKADGYLAMQANAAELDTLQEKLWAQGATGGERSVLLVVQGMDTAGKGGVMRHVVGSVDPQGVKLKAFKAPTAAEKRHDFLWRIRKELPAPGYLGVFDRSHYEDVLIARVHEVVEKSTWQQRYKQINAFERELVETHHTTVLKVMLHVSKEEQSQRLMERLDRPDKHWKFSPADLDEREHWSEYQEAYQAALTRCTTKPAPWFVVPADRKWYSRLAIQQLLLEHLRGLDLAWPQADFDVVDAKARLAGQIAGREVREEAAEERAARREAGDSDDGDDGDDD